MPGVYVRVEVEPCASTCCGESRIGAGVGPDEHGAACVWGGDGRCEDGGDEVDE